MEVEIHKNLGKTGTEPCFGHLRDQLRSCDSLNTVNLQLFLRRVLRDSCGARRYSHDGGNLLLSGNVHMITPKKKELVNR